MPVKPRVLVVHCLVQAHGGACGVLCWLLQALRDHYHLTLLTWHPIDLPALNRHFGTSLKPTDFQVRHVPPAIRKIFEFDPDPGSIQKNAYLARTCKRIRTNFDVVISSDNEVDFGKPALQYVHVPHLAHVYPKVAHHLEMPPAKKLAALFRGEIRPWMLVGGYSFERMQRNRTMVNSDWTGRWVRRVYGIDSVTVYPPAAGDFPDIPWEQREDGFVVIGRLHRDKRPLWCLRVLEIVRRSFPAIKLHIIGAASAWPDEVAYYRELAPVVKENAPWVTLHENISREAMQSLVARQRYGMHAMKDEHFGMAVAEMVLAGCIPFVHNSGGPPETAGHDPRLIYRSAEEAAEKITCVLASPAQQARIRARLAPRRDLFRPETFMNSIRAEVSRALAETRRL
jgi:glycosyltransferase involved in cell wall biosynthesis